MKDLLELKKKFKFYNHYLYCLIRQQYLREKVKGENSEDIRLLADFVDIIERTMRANLNVVDRRKTIKSLKKIYFDLSHNYNGLIKEFVEDCEDRLLFYKTYLDFESKELYEEKQIEKISDYLELLENILYLSNFDRINFYNRIKVETIRMLIIDSMSFLSVNKNINLIVLRNNELFIKNLGSEFTKVMSLRRLIEIMIEHLEEVRKNENCSETIEVLSSLYGLKDYIEEISKESKSISLDSPYFFSEDKQISGKLRKLGDWKLRELKN